MLTWIVVICFAVVILGIIYLRKYLFKKRNERMKKDYDEGVKKINEDIAEKVKHDQAEGMQKAEEIRANALKNSNK